MSRQYRRPEEMGEFLRLARQVSAKTYQERLLNTACRMVKGFCANSKRRRRENKSAVLSCGATLNRRHMHIAEPLETASNTW